MAKRIKTTMTLPDGNTCYVTGDKLEDLVYNSIKKYMANMAVQAPVFSQISLKDFIETIYKPTYFTSLADTTRFTHENYLKNYIYPYLGNLLLSEISVKHIQNFYIWMAEGSKHGMKKNLTSNTIEIVGKVLTKIFNIAVSLDYIRKNPVDKHLLKNPGVKSVHHSAIPESIANNARKLIPQLKNERQRLFMALLAIETGMRPEEILGLRWEDINWDDGYIEIKRTLTYLNQSTPNIKEGGKTELSARPIIMTDALKNILLTASNKTGYIIHGKTSEDPVSRATYVRTYKESFKLLGLEKYTPYDWRSTFAQEQIENGLTTKQVADMMGHSSTKMVESVYTNRRKEGILKNRDKINQKSEHYFPAT